MLKYFEQLTVDLMIPAILVGMLYAFIKFKLGKSCRIAFLAGGGLAIAASLMLVRGTLQVMAVELSSALSASISGMAGIGHILLGTGMILLLVTLKKTAQ